MPEIAVSTSSPATTAIRSMTGQGRAQLSDDLGTFSVEIRSVNHRGVKCSLRTSDSLSTLTPKIESLIRSQIHRGSLNINVSFKPAAGDTSVRISQETVANYYRQLKDAQRLAEVDEPIDWTGLLQLPGTLVSDDRRDHDLKLVWQSVRSALLEAIGNLNAMRIGEGREMLHSLDADLRVITDNLSEIESLAPQAAQKHHTRLRSKIEQTLAENQLSVDSIDLIREVQLFADRVDISEEVTRLHSHLKLFGEVIGCEAHPGGVVDAPATLNEASRDSFAATNTNRAAASEQPDPAGRKLDFVIQEMFRETNTIGSKASHAVVAKHVVEIKCGLERMRELVQNLE